MGLGLGLAFIGVTAGLAWWLGGSVAWEVGHYVLGVPLALITLPALIYGLPRLKRESSWARLFVFCVFFGWAAVGVWYAVGSMQMGGVVHIDNASAQEVKIELDGKP
jgi:hypothetical protein